MSQIIYPITHLPPVIDIGKQTEKGVTRIGFDVHEWLDDWPGMRFSVQPTRPGETDSYLAVSEMVGSVVFWLVGAVDTEKPGSGTVEVLGVTEDERKLSFMCRTAIANTNTATVAEVPEPNKPWVDRVILAADSAAKNATESEASADKAAASAKEAEESVQDFFIVTAAPKKEGVPVFYADKTQEEIREAVAAGKTCLLVYNASTSSVPAGMVCTYSGEDKYDADETESPCFFAGVKYNTQAQRWYQYTSYVRADGHVGTIGKVMRTQTSSVLKFTGAVNAQFDGTNPVTVDIPSNDVFVVKITHDGSKWVVDKTAAEIIEALIAGKACILTGYSAGATMPLLYVDGNDVLFGCYRHESFGEGMTGILLSLFRIKSNGTVETGIEFPATTPNPYSLHIIGAVEAEYDGSSAVTVEIPSGGSGPFTVNATITTMSDDNLTGYAIFDKTFAETLAAVKAGRYVTCRVDVGDGVVHIVPACGYGSDFVEFILAVNGAQLRVQYFEGSEEGSVEITPPAS